MSKHEIDVHPNTPTKVGVKYQFKVKALKGAAADLRVMMWWMWRDAAGKVGRTILEGRTAQVALNTLPDPYELVAADQGPNHVIAVAWNRTAPPPLAYEPVNPADITKGWKAKRDIDVSRAVTWRVTSFEVVP